MADDETRDDELVYISLWDDVQETVGPADGQKITLVRAGFLEQLVEDPRVIKRLPDLLEATQALAEALEAGGRTHPDVARVNLGCRRISEQLVREELGLDWPWVQGAVFRTVIRMLKRELPDMHAGLPPLGEFVVYSPTIRIKVGPGIPIDEVIQEIRDLLTRLEQIQAEAMKPDPVRRHAVRSEDEARIRAWGRWYYRRFVFPKITERALARDEQKDRRTIRVGVAEAKRLLSLGSYRF